MTPEQHRFEFHESTYTQIFLINILEKCLEICDNLKELTDKAHGLEISKIKKKVCHECIKYIDRY